MVSDNEEDTWSSKRRRLELDLAAEAGRTPPPLISESGASQRKSLQRPISPPESKRTPLRTPSATPLVQAVTHAINQSPPSIPLKTRDDPKATTEDKHDVFTYISSPVQLTGIKDLAADQNVDAVELQDILGDPMIKECWNFNYLFDIDFVMNHFDADVKGMVKVKIVHGFWKREDGRRIRLMETAERYSNVELIPAYIPDPYGTHHSKMIICFRHDDLAQVIIHTANMIDKDWRNMTQAMWRSPLLPFQSNPPTSQSKGDVHPIGSGERFKVDLLNYLGAYGKRLNELTRQLVNYDFSTIHAAFLGSAPSRQKPNDARPLNRTSFGWLGLKEILSTIPIQPNARSSRSNIVVQVSSIATLGQTPAWLNHLQSVLSRTNPNEVVQTRPSSFKEDPVSQPTSNSLEPTLNVIFPTASEIRTSLDGYASGGSIHTKIQSAAQKKQLEYLKPLFCHWKYSLPETEAVPRRSAYRGPAAPHIKTYIRFSNTERQTIDWAMVTSANLSKQAWGDLENKKGEIWIQSWETGIVVWPDLFSSGGNSVMVPMFGKDMPGAKEGNAVKGRGMHGRERGGEGTTIIGFRMPYDLPLSPYGADEVPWCATMAHEEPDWAGRTWVV